jgi:hypothetical protein
MKHAVQRVVWLPTKVLDLGPSKTAENLVRVGRSKDLPDGDRVLASSPSLNTQT